MEDEARRLATLITTAWQESYGHALIEVPMSMVASVALFDTHATSHTPRPMAEVVELHDHAFLQELYARWNLSAHTWPRLHHLWLPWFGWTGKQLMFPNEQADQRIITAARHIGALAVREELADLIAEVHTSARCDVLSHILHPLHAQLQKHRPAPEPTPRLVPPGTDSSWSDQLHPGAVIEDPAAWSGTRIMHLVRDLYRRGIDPRTLTWRLRTTNPVAAATLATSCALWGLSEASLIGTSAKETTWVHTAEKEVRAALLRRLGQC